MKRIHTFLIGAKYAVRLFKLQLALKVLDLGESLFLRMTGWKRQTRGNAVDPYTRWKRPNRSNGFTISTPHAAASTTFYEMPSMIAQLQKNCRVDQMHVLYKNELKREFPQKDQKDQ